MATQYNNTQSEDASLVSRLRDERNSYMYMWRRLNEFYEMRQDLFDDYSSGTNARDGETYWSNSIVDESATLTIQTSTAGMQSGITPPSRPWFVLESYRPQNSLSRDERIWYDKVTLIQQTSLHFTNFYTETIPFYHNLLVYGTALMYMEETNDDSYAWFKTLPMGSFMIGSDHRDNVNTVVREYRMTTSQLEEMFGFENLSDRTQQMLRDGKTQEWVQVQHIVKPNRKYVSGSDNKMSKKFISRHVESTAQTSNTTINLSNPQDYHVLRTGGYDNFPYFCARWALRSGEVYANSCPGINALPSTMQLQNLNIRDAQGLEYQVNPHLLAPSILRGENTSFLPGGVSFVGDNEGLKGFKSAFEINYARNEILELEEIVRQRISKAFYENLFLNNSQIGNRDRVTATEIDSRDEEKYAALSPTMERLDKDFLYRVNSNFFNTLHKAGRFPDAPSGIQGEPIKVRPISTLAQAQHYLALGQLDRFSTFVANLSQFAPDVLYKIDFDVILEKYGEITGIPQEALRESEAVAALKEATEQRQQQAEQAQSLQSEASALKDLAEAGVLGGERKVS